MTIFFTADHHFGHANIINYCNRPYSNVIEMNEDLINKWNSKVTQNDLVIHVGDYIFDKRLFWDHTWLSGNMILIKGNHDKRAIYEQITWVPYMFMRIGEFYCLINHRPMYDKYELDPMKESDPNLSRDMLKGVDFVLCGHVHDRWLWNGRNFNVGVDVHDFYPISLDEVRECLENKE